METDKTDRRAKSETKPEHSSLETLTQMGLRRRATAIVAGVSVVTAGEEGREVKHIAMGFLPSLI